VGAEFSPNLALMRDRDEPARGYGDQSLGGRGYGEAMAQGRAQRFWRPSAARKPRVLLTAFGALAFNIGLLILPLAGAAASLMVVRDKLYTYDTSAATAKAVRARVERLAGKVIMLDFDRRRQWDDLIAMELIAGDVGAARGFLLSARSMLSQSDGNTLDRLLRRNASDADLELAALELLTPGTRNRYEATVPLLSRRSASGLARYLGREAALGDQHDFELLANAMIAEAEPDALQFVLTGLGLGLGPELTPRMLAGAGALLAASRNEQYGRDFDAEIGALIARAAPRQAFRADARRRAGEDDPSGYKIASEAFHATLDARGAAELVSVLDEIGQIVEATSAADGAVILTHARGLADLPRLRQVAMAAGDRAAATAKRSPHDGALPNTAQGTLTFTRALIERLAIAAAAGAIVLLCALLTVFSAVRDFWERRFARAPQDEEEHDLVDHFGAGRAY
jgi:hypothetical protein